MTPEERFVADYTGMGVSLGRHMAQHRDALRADARVERPRPPYAAPWRERPHCRFSHSAATPRHCAPLYLSSGDETGISNGIIEPDLYKQNRAFVTYATSCS